MSRLSMWYIFKFWQISFFDYNWRWFIFWEQNSMKVVFPKHIKKWLIAGMSFSIGPITLSIIQLFIMAIGIAAGLGIFNAVSKNGSKAMGIIIGLPVIIIFLVIAFFKISELTLLPFAAKLIRNNFFDTTKKFQTNHVKPNPLQLMLKKISLHEKKQAITQKERHMNKDLLDKIKGGWLL